MPLYFLHYFESAYQPPQGLSLWSGLEVGGCLEHHLLIKVSCRVFTNEVSWASARRQIVRCPKFVFWIWSNLG